MNKSFFFLKKKANLHFFPPKFRNVAILVPYKKNGNFGPFRPKIAENTPRVPKKRP